MKHKLIGIIMVGILLVTLVFTGAAYTQDGDLPSPGLTPDSPFYFLDKLVKNIGMFFTFGVEAKVKKSLQYAEERLAEAREMASASKSAALESAIVDYEKYMASLQERLGEINGQEAPGNISERITLATSKHLEVLARVREQAKEKAQNTIARAEDASVNGQFNALRVIARNELERAFDVCDNITAQQMERIWAMASDDITPVNMTRELDYAARIADLEDELVAIGEATSANVTALRLRLANSTANRLETLSVIYKRATESDLPGLKNAIENSVMKYERVINELEEANITTAPINEVLEIIPEKLRERIQVSVTNQLQICVGADDATQFRTATETQERNREHLEHNGATVSPITVTVTVNAN